MNSMVSPSRGRVGGATLAALAALALAITLASTSSAQAAGTCPGGLIAHQPLTAGLGWLDVYYDGTTGRNCARVVSSAGTWGVPKVMSVELVRCSSTKPSQRCGTYDTSRDRGTYKYYAGPVSISARGHCILAYGYVQTSSSSGYAQLGRTSYLEGTPAYGVHCG